SWLNIRKVTAQRTENNQKNYKKNNFYIISIEIVFIYLSWTFLSQPLVISLNITHSMFIMPFYLNDLIHLVILLLKNIFNF
ncbi:hypothetical protein D0417_11110, partial [Staphylococcus epidermidis]|nr:hypothetical protein [Staphylococcus epidermidis]